MPKIMAKSLLSTESQLPDTGQATGPPNSFACHEELLLAVYAGHNGQQVQSRWYHSPKQDILFQLPLQPPTVTVHAQGSAVQAVLQPADPEVSAACCASSFKHQASSSWGAGSQRPCQHVQTCWALHLEDLVLHHRPHLHLLATVSAAQLLCPW